MMDARTNGGAKLRGFCTGCGAEIAEDQPCIDDGAEGLICATCALRDGEDADAETDRAVIGPPAPVGVEQLAVLAASGLVRRWHQNPVMAETGQTLADHQGRCVQLLLALNPGASPALIRAVAFHDVGEFGAGDLSGPLKRAQPGLAARHAAFEGAVRQAICGPDPWLLPREEAWLKLVDGLEVMVWALLTRPWEVERKTAGWAAMRIDLQQRAAYLGCEAEVTRLLSDLADGVW